MAVVCLVTPGQPSTNPRLVKEADALVEAGHTVHVVCAHWAPWADETDRALLASSRFSCTYVGGRPGNFSTYLWTRIRHRLGRNLLRCPVTSAAPTWALCRVSPELQRAAERIKADLYIAHNLGALPAAWGAARRHGARLGFDAEDFHSGMSPQSEISSVETVLTEHFERQILPQCDYVTAAAPLIAERYELKYSIKAPKIILNVFPLKERPAAIRETCKGGALTLCWFSQTIGAGRGIEDVIRAMGLLKDQNIELHLLGDWQAGYKEKVGKLARLVGLPQSRVQTHDTALPSKMVSWAAKYDIGLAVEQPDSLNRNICLTNKIFTYLLAGNAVIATATDGQRKLMEEIDGAGFCYKPGDVSSLAEQLRLWLTDKADLNTVRRRAWNYGTQKFNWDMEKSKFLNVVDSVLSLPTERVA